MMSDQISQPMTHVTRHSTPSTRCAPSRRMDELNVTPAGQPAIWLQNWQAQPLPQGRLQLKQFPPMPSCCTRPSSPAVCPLLYGESGRSQEPPTIGTVQRSAD